MGVVRRSLGWTSSIGRCIYAQWRYRSITLRSNFLFGAGKTSFIAAGSEQPLQFDSLSVATRKM